MYVTVKCGRQDNSNNFKILRKEASTPGGVAFGIGKLQVLTKDADSQAAAEVQFTVISATGSSLDDEQDMIVTRPGTHLPEQLFDHPALQGCMQCAEWLPHEQHSFIACRGSRSLTNDFSYGGFSQTGKQIFILCQTVCRLTQRFSDTCIKMLF